MNVLLQQLAMTQMTIRNLGENRNHANAEQLARTLALSEKNFVFWFTAMLRMINLHRATFDSPSQSTSQRPHALLDQSRLLITICCIALSRSPLGLVFRQEAQPPSSDLSSERPPAASTSLQTYALDIAATLVDTLPDDARQQCARFLKERCPPFLHVQNEPRFLYILGPVADTVTSSTSQQGSASSPAPSGPASAMTPSATSSAPSSSANTTTLMSTGMTAGSDALANRLRVLNRGRVMGPYPLRPWEMLEEAAPMAGINDTAVDLGFFGARKVRE
jgi:mediator of RNA polymerase II transcription subunit 12